MPTVTEEEKYNLLGDKSLLVREDVWGGVYSYIDLKRVASGIVF